MISHYCLYCCPFFTRTPDEDSVICLNLLSQPSHIRQIREVSFLPSVTLPGVLEGCIFPHIPLSQEMSGKLEELLYG